MRGRGAGWREEWRQTRQTNATPARLRDPTPVLRTTAPHSNVIYRITLGAPSLVLSCLHGPRPRIIVACTPRSPPLQSIVTRVDAARACGVVTVATTRHHSETARRSRVASQRRGRRRPRCALINCQGATVMTQWHFLFDGSDCCCVGHARHAVHGAGRCCYAPCW